MPKTSLMAARGGRISLTLRDRCVYVAPGQCDDPSVDGLLKMMISATVPRDELKVRPLSALSGGCYFEVPPFRQRPV